jgi:ABC-type polysaccharide/polyol phosphate transport system ATPase subunit
MSDSILIDARAVGFNAPLIQPQERSILTNPANLLADFYLNKPSRHSQTLLSNITFTLSAGQRIGLIGPNGAGKSTLLRLLGGVYKPTRGTLTLNCTPRGLFDISLGFVGDATGLENIYLRSLEMGLSMPQIRGRIPEIIAFSELGEVIDKPFSSFSSGMRLRLAVALALIDQPDVMLLDEWIGAGDAGFQKKVGDRMNAMVDASRGLIFASHNDQLLTRVCTHGLVLKKGHVIHQGPIKEALKYYHEHVRPALKPGNAEPAPKSPPQPSQQT